MKYFYTLLFIIILSPFQAYCQVDLSKGLVAHYPFNGNANDSTANNNDGMLMGNPTLATDRFGIANRCYRFNGTGDHIIVQKDAAHEPKDAVSVSAWVNAEDFSSWLMVVCKRLRHNSSPGNSYILFAAGSPGANQNWSFGVSGSTSANEKFIIDPVVAKTQEWVFLTGTYDKNASDSNVRVYVNGILVKQEKASYDIQYSDSSLRIGMAIPGAQQFFKGKIDDVRIYNRALNHQEVTALYAMPNVSVKEVDEKLFNIFPNPTTNNFFIDGDYKSEDVKVKLYDLSGRLVLEQLLDNTGAINVEGFKKGIYVIELTQSRTNMIIEHQKLVIE